MKIKIAENFVIKVPRFTDDLNYLKKLYKLNFGMFKFENEDYKNLSEKIILSENDNWEKAIGIAILNVKLISKQIFTKVATDDYPYYKYPYIMFSSKITYVVEELATKTIPKLIKQYKSGKDEEVYSSTYISNAVIYSIRLMDNENLRGSFAKLDNLPKIEDKRRTWQNYYDEKRRYQRLHHNKENFDYIKRLNYVNKRINYFQNVKSDAKAEIDFLNDKLQYLLDLENKLTKGTKFGDISFLYDILLNESKTEFEDAIKGYVFQEYIELESRVKKDIKEMQSEDKLASPLEKFVDEKKLLELIIKSAKSTESLDRICAYMSDLEILDPRNLTQVIDSNTYLIEHPVLLEEYCDLRNDINAVLNTLNDNEENTIRLRYLIPRTENEDKNKRNYKKNDGTVRTYREIGLIFGLSANRIRVILAEGFRKLRHPTRSDIIRPCLSMNIADEINEVRDEHNILPMNWKK